MDPTKNRFLFLDCQLTSPFTPTRFWQQVLKSLSRQAVEGAMLQGGIDRLLAQKEITSADFVNVLDTLYELGQVLIMILDEFKWLIRTDSSFEAMTRDFLSGLRALVNRRPRVMCLVVTTRKPLDDRDELQRRGLIVRRDDGYEIFSFLFRQWISANKFSDYGDQDRLHSLREQLEIHRNNLNRLEVKRAQYGLAVSLHLDNEIEYVRKEIARLEIEILALEEWG